MVVAWAHRPNPISANSLWLGSPKQSWKSMRVLVRAKDSGVGGKIREKNQVCDERIGFCCGQAGALSCQSSETLGYMHDASAKEGRGAGPFTFLSYS